MPVCSYCGSPIEPGQKFCTNCGAEITTLNIQHEQEEAPPQPKPFYEEVEEAPKFEEPVSQPPAYSESSYPQVNEPEKYDAKTIVGAVFSFLFPFVGLILYLVWRKSKPRAASLCLTCAGVAIIINGILRLFS
jgi:hypothetical protein